MVTVHVDRETIEALERLATARSVVSEQPVTLDDVVRDLLARYKG